MVDYLGNVKIADFGLAKFKKGGDELHTKGVATRWYRAPEVLYGSNTYDETVDLWALGCILGELHNRKPLFQADNDIGMLTKIFDILGQLKVNQIFS